MVNKNSIEAWTAVNESDYVGRKQKEIYNHLYHLGPLTANEIDRDLYSRKKTTTSNVHARLGELIQIGIVEKVGDKLDELTEKTNGLFMVTNQKPKRYVKPPSKTKIIHDLKEALMFYRDNLGKNEGGGVANQVLKKYERFL